MALNRTKYEKDSYVWLPSEEECWIPARVVEPFMKGDEGNVVLLHGKKEQQASVLRDGSSRSMPMNEESMKIFSNMVDMQDLNEASILHNIRSRFKKNKVYTNIGKVLVSVNPYKLLPLYTPDVIEDFKQNGYRDNHPHVYGIADDAYRCMLSEGTPQSCIISGESGSGKTEVTKLFLQYIAELSGGMRTLKDIQRGEEAPLQEQLLRANPLLESFGNAKTTRNDNSSRFGKWIGVFFDRKGTVIKGSITNYLLEKSRIVAHAPGERNYHIFYQLIAACASDPGLREKYKLGDVSEYNYLISGFGSKEYDGESDDSDDEEAQQRKNDAYANDEADFEVVRGCMDVLNLSSKEKSDIFRTVAGILHLGNIKFSALQQKNQEDKAQIANLDGLETCARQFGLEPEALAKGLTTKTFGGRSGSVVQIALKPSEAIQARDALAKSIYSSLFAWLTQAINRALSKGGGAGASVEQLTSRQIGLIGILDIYGFEVFESNSFEQLCINYCNEKLQAYFNEHMFKLEQARYAQDGLEVSKVNFLNNDSLVGLFENKPNGIFAMLDDECGMASGTETSFLGKLLTTGAIANEGTVEKPSAKVKNYKASFIILHYAGKVIYSTTNMLEKNRDVLPMDLISTFQKSSLPFVVSLFDMYGSISSNGAPSERVVSITSTLPISAANASSTNQESSNTSVTGSVRRASYRALNAVMSSVKKGVASLSPSPVGQQSMAKKTLVTQFRDQLNELVKALNEMNPHFIRCIKPNSRAQSDNFTSPAVLRQIKYSGILDIVKIRKLGYPVNILHEDFVFQYGLLVPNEKSKDAKKLVEALNMEGITDSSEIKVGKSRVFMKFSQQMSLQEKRGDALNKTVIKMQRVSRMFVQRKKYKGFLRLLDKMLHAQLSRDEQELEQCLTEAGELPNFGRHIDIVENGRKLMNRFVEEKRVTDLLQTAVASRDVSLLQSTLAIAKRMKLSSSRADEVISSAQKLLDKINGQKNIRQDLTNAMESNSKDLLQVLSQAVKSAQQAEATELEEYLFAKVLLERLEGLSSIELDLDVAAKLKDEMKILRVLKRAVVLGMDSTPAAERCRNARKVIRDQKRLIQTINALMKARNLSELKVAISKAESSNVDPNHLQAAKDLRTSLEKEDAITREIAKAAAKRDTPGLNAALQKAQELGVQNSDVITESRLLLQKMQKKKELEQKMVQAIKANQLSQLAITYILAADLGMSSGEAYFGVQNALKKSGKNADLFQKIHDAVAGGDAETLLVLIDRAKASGFISESDLEIIKDVLNRIKLEDTIVSELNEAMALGEASRLKAGLAKANAMDDFASRNHFTFEKAKAAVKAIEIAETAVFSGDPTMINNAVAAARSAHAQEEGPIAECIRLQGMFNYRENVIKSISAALAQVTSAEANEDATTIGRQANVLELIKNVSILIDRVPETMMDDDIIVDAKEKIARYELIDEALTSISTATEENDLQKLNHGITLALQLGIGGRELDMAKKLRVKLTSQQETVNEMMAEINLVKLRMNSKGGVVEADVESVQNAIKRAKAAGLSGNQKQLKEAVALETRLKRQLVVQLELQSALLSNDFTKLKLAMDHANEIEVETEAATQVRAAVRTHEIAKRAAQQAAFENNQKLNDEPEISEEDIKKERDQKLQKASNPRYHFTRYQKIRSDEDFAKGAIFGKKKIITEKLSYQTTVINRSILVMDRQSSKIATRIHQDILGYCGDKSMSFPAGLAQDILTKVLENHDLSDEVYIQLFKHLTRNTKLDSVSKAWQLLTLVVGTFPPSLEFELFVLNFFQSYLNVAGVVGTYAKYCLRRVEGVLNSGASGFVPSAAEILTYKDRPPILGSIELVDGTPLTVDLPITPDLNVGKVRDICAHFLGLRDPRISDLFGIFVIDLTERRKARAAVEAARAFNDPEAAARATNSASIAKTPRPLSDSDYMGNIVMLMARLKHDFSFVYKRKLYFSDSDIISDDPLYRRLVFIQAQDDFVNGNLRCQTEADVTSMIATSVAAFNDPFPATIDALIDIDVLSYVPRYLRHIKTDREWALNVINQTDRVANEPQDYLQDKFVDVLKRNPLFGACMFHATRTHSEEAEVMSLPVRLVCALNSAGLHLLNEETWQVVRVYPYSSINRWGGNARLFSFSIARIENENRDNNSSASTPNATTVEKSSLPQTSPSAAAAAATSLTEKKTLSKAGKSTKKIKVVKSSFELALQMAQAGDMSTLLSDYVAAIVLRKAKAQKESITTATTKKG